MISTQRGKPQTAPFLSLLSLTPHDFNTKRETSDNSSPAISTEYRACSKTSSYGLNLPFSRFIIQSRHCSQFQFVNRATSKLLSFNSLTFSVSSASRVLILEIRLSILAFNMLSESLSLEQVVSNSLTFSVSSVITSGSC